MANAKIIAYVEARNAQQNAINDAKHATILNEAQRANLRLDDGVVSALAAAAAAEGPAAPAISRVAIDLRVDAPPSHGPPNPQNLQEQFDWLYAKTAKLAEAVIAMVEAQGERMARPKDGGGI